MTEHEEPEFPNEHPEVREAIENALPLSQGSKDHIVSLIKERLGHDSEITVGLDDPDYETMSIQWLPEADVSGVVGVVSLWERSDAVAEIRWSWEEFQIKPSPDGWQFEKRIQSITPEDAQQILDNLGTEELSEVQEERLMRYNQALMEEQALGITLVTEDEGQRLIRLIPTGEKLDE
jgi:hypothetical protein